MKKSAASLATQLAWGLTLAVGMASVGVGCGGDVQAGIDSANELMFRKQYVDAERLYRKLLRRIEDGGPELDEESDQQRLMVLDRLGKVHALYLHDYEAAIRHYQQLVRLYPKTDHALGALTMIADIYHHKLGNVQAAIDAYQRIAAEFPDRPETRGALLKIANAYFQLKNYEQARTEADRLVNAWPNTPEAAQARFQTANSFYLQGRYPEAIATFEKLFETKPDPELEALVLFELGNCFQELEEPERALAYYYASLADHSDPMLVQRKIKRVRKRISNTKPAASILLPAYLQDRLAAVRGAGVSVTTEAEKAAAESARQAARQKRQSLGVGPEGQLGTHPPAGADPLPEPMWDETVAPAPRAPQAPAPTGEPKREKFKPGPDLAAPGVAPSDAADPTEEP